MTAESYWWIIGRRFAKNKIAVIGLIAVGLFFAIALSAPFLAGRLPFYWVDSAGEISFPFWREFFAPSDTRERLLDLAFNYLLLVVVFGTVVAAVFRNERRRYFLIGGAIVLGLPFIFTTRRNQPLDYRIAVEQGNGHGIFPLIPCGVNEQTLFRAKMPPSWSARGAREYRENNLRYSYLGTDEVGRDVAARLIHGSRVSLTVGLISVLIATVIGIVVGAIAGYYGGWIDIIISRVMEIMICFPTFFLILTVIAFLDHRSIINIMLIIGLTGWTGTALVVRGEIFKQRSLDYVAAARVLGAGDWRIIFRHILPNSLAPVLVGMSFGIAGAIGMESGLSFLGIGVAAPTATWGELLMEGRDSPLPNWWLSIFPGIAIFLAMTAYNLVGEGLRDAMDPKLRR